ncbi:hypothetical protein [Agitococcus lubricus]|uniref:Uncharacterized protein n=1 Tax=Agitococcus lubricus TaxID=1077255 RepID=A0A2T5ITE4_9GAMM|nr:hypothetical protein [Agitococcus lubricus]PTQ87083.1 hypothetical protein C8N29_1245 [Agitococcus lubricus]
MMPVTFSPIITDLGQGVFVPLATGIEFTFTHVAVGTGTSAVNSTATALENEIARFPIAGGGINSGGKSASINALITNHTNANPQNYNISEIGFFGLDASSNTILFAIYRQGTTIINKVAGVDIAIPFSLGLGALPASNITVQLDTNISAMMALLGQHTSLNHPHTQYKRTLNNTERLKIADGVDNDEAVSKGQLNAEATTRAGVDSALAALIAQEVLDRQAGDANQSNGYLNTPIMTLTDGDTDSLVLSPNQVVRVLLVGGGAGGGMCNENPSGANDYSGHPNNGIAEDGTPSTVEIDHLALVIARADNGTGGKSGMRDTGGGAPPYNGYTGVHGGGWAHSGYTILLGAQIDTRESPRYQSMPRAYPYQAYRINGTSLDDYGRGGDGAATAGAITYGGIGGYGGNGGIVEVLIKNTGTTDMVLNLVSGTKGQGYYQDLFGDDYAGHDGTGGLVVVYA